MTRHSDDELRAQFQALRRDTELGAPVFGATMSGVPRQRRRAARARRRVAAIALGAATAVALLAVFGPHRKTTVLVDLAAARWEAPTDFLLRAPSAELLPPPPTLPPEERLLPRSEPRPLP